MIKKICFLTFIIFVLSCKKNVNTLPSETLWVYVQVGVEGESFNDNIYGEISKTDLNEFGVNSKSEKLFFISNVRVIDNDSIIKDISVDSNEKGSYYYKIKEIKYLEILKKDPINSKTSFVID